MPGAALQRGLVVFVDRRAIQLDLCARRERERRGQQQDCQQMLEFFVHVFAHYMVTRSGTGLVLSIAEYQGISRKNEK